MRGVHIDKLTNASRKVHAVENSRSKNDAYENEDEPGERINTIYFPVLNFLDGFSNVDVRSSDVHSLILLA